MSYLSSIVKKCCSSLSSIARLGIWYPLVSVHVMHEFLGVHFIHNTSSTEVIMVTCFLCHAR